MNYEEIKKDFDSFFSEHNKDDLDVWIEKRKIQIKRKEWEEWYKLNKTDLDNHNISFILTDINYGNKVALFMDGIVGDNHIDFKFEAEFNLFEVEMFSKSLEFLKEMVVYKRKLVEDK